MSFREKSAWISLALYLLVYGYYGWTLYDVVQAGQTATYDYLWLLVKLIVVLVILQSVLHGVVAVLKPRDALTPEDEREKLIWLKSTSFGFYVLLIGALSVSLWIAYGGQEFYTANGLFFVVVLSEIARSGTQIVRMRMGA